MSQTDDGQTDATTQDRRVHVRTGREPYRSTIQVRGHNFFADESTAAGGTDAGPSPHELLAASLAACTTITLRMYADRKEWPLEEVVARVEHRRVTVQAGITAPGSSDRFLLDLELHGPLDDSQRARLMEIAERCPVHRTLLNGATVELRET